VVAAVNAFARRRDDTPPARVFDTLVYIAALIVISAVLAALHARWWQYLVVCWFVWLVRLTSRWEAL
jgi:hypothetical protein